MHTRTIDNRARISVLVCVAATLAACSQGPADDEPSAFERLEGIETSEVPTWESFEESLRQVEDGQVFYVVEGDIVLDRPGLERYYYDRFLAFEEKSTGYLVNDGTTTFADRRALPALIRYCYTSGWDPNGISAARLTDVQDAVDTAAAEWAAGANVSYVHVAALDGVSCTTGQVPSGVDFIITQHPNANSADAPFPSVTAASQRLRVGTNAATMGILRHELGHVLGLRHEQVHPDAGLGCLEGSVSPLPAGWSDQGTVALSEYDPGSVMHYTSGGVPGCSGGTTSNAPITWLDGVGARMLYGPPVSWIVAVL
jgi:serralysin